MWEYRARILNVVDGDTLDVMVDVGFHGRQIERLRLLGVDTPERGDPLWAGATSETRAWVLTRERDYYLLTGIPSTSPNFWPFMIQTEKADSFGRYLAKVWPYSHMSPAYCLNDHLRVDMGWPDLSRPYA
jgi:micrococcal nuclease